MADEVNAETKTSGGNPIWNLVRLVMDRFNSGDWNPGNRDEPIISSVAPPTYVNPGSVAGPSSVAAPGSVSIQQPGSVLQPGSMMGPQSVNALQYGMHRQPMGGPRELFLQDPYFSTLTSRINANESIKRRTTWQCRRSWKPSTAHDESGKRRTWKRWWTRKCESWKCRISTMESTISWPIISSSSPPSAISTSIIDTEIL